jgi:hypothetical protein
MRAKNGSARCFWLAGERHERSTIEFFLNT